MPLIPHMSLKIGQVEVEKTPKPFAQTEIENVEPGGANPGIKPVTGVPPQIHSGRSGSDPAWTDSARLWGKISEENLAK